MQELRRKNTEPCLLTVMSCESDSAEDLSALSSRSVETSDLHIWRISASEWGSEVPLLMTVMSQDERERACRFVFEADRSRFIVARGLLRFLLSAYTSRLPEELTFCSGRNGKPFLNTQDDVNFNVSHSGEIVLIAISRGQQVGIDVECGGRTFSVQNLAQSCLTECEYSAFKRLPKEEREEAFLRGGNLAESIKSIVFYNTASLFWLLVKISLLITQVMKRQACLAPEWGTATRYNTLYTHPPVVTTRLFP